MKTPYAMPGSPEPLGATWDGRGTNFALYSEGAGRDSWQYKLFGWVFAIWPNSQDVHTWHHLGMWGIVVFVIIHVYAAVREDIMSRQSLISSMVSGERLFRDEYES